MNFKIEPNNKTVFKISKKTKKKNVNFVRNFNSKNKIAINIPANKPQINKLAILCILKNQ